MNKIFTSIIVICSLSLIAFAANRCCKPIKYDLSEGTVDIRSVQINGHEYIVAAACGERRMGSSGAAGAGIAILHAPSCPCYAISITNNYINGVYGPSAFGVPL